MNVIASCQANTTQAICGTADGGSYIDASYANAAGLCDAGIASPNSLTNPGPWNRSCDNGGNTTNCNATLDTCTVEPVDLDCSGTAYEPVCGCDDNTYYNSCYAQTAGIGSRIS